MLRNKEIPLVKVLWEYHKEEEATWELESKILEKYPYLFEFKPDNVLWISERNSCKEGRL